MAKADNYCIVILKVPYIINHKNDGVLQISVRKDADQIVFYHKIYYLT